MLTPGPGRAPVPGVSSAATAACDVLLPGIELAHETAHGPRPVRLSRLRLAARTERARRYFQAGEQALAQGRYEEVARAYEKLEVLLLELARAGSLVHARLSGVLAGLKETLRETIDTRPVVSLDSDGQFKTSLEKVRKHVRGSKARYVLVGAVNDESALGASRAFQRGRPRGDVRDRGAERGAGCARS